MKAPRAAALGLRLGLAAAQSLRARGGTEEMKKRARARALEILGSGRGLSAKLAQFLAMSDPEEFALLQNGAVPPLPFDEVEAALARSYGAPASALFSSLDEEGRPASLGQVHFGRTRSGADVAVKLRYPGIAEAVAGEIALLGWMPAAGPARRWGFDMAGYRTTLGATLAAELDYPAEAARQIRYRALAADLPGLVVPEVLAPLCRADVLVQRREDGVTLETARRRPPAERAAMGRAALAHVLHMAFRRGFVHADPNPANYAFRPRAATAEWDLVLYDYGCVLELSAAERLALLRVVLALQDREPVDAVACLAAAGFDAEKLRDLGPRLPALLAAVFEPFLRGEPFDVAAWDLGARVDRVAGDLKWWLRSAAPPRLLLLMRVFHGLCDLLARLDVRLDWKSSLAQAAGAEFAAARALDLPSAPAAAARFDRMASRLRVRVEKADGRVVELAFPARAAEDFRSLMDDEVLIKAAAAGVDAAAVQRRLHDTGLEPQTLFAFEEAGRSLRVWLE